MAIFSYAFKLLNQQDTERCIITLVFGFYGRSGQGVETAARLLSKAAFSCGFQVQSFAFTARSRRGSPVTAYVKLDKAPIESRQPEEADFALVFDPTLSPAAKQLKEKSMVIFNSPEKIASPVLKNRKVRAYTVDATEIALNHLKANIPNTIMLGALVKIFPKISMKAMKTAMEGLPRENAAAFDEGYRSVK